MTDFFYVSHGVRAAFLVLPGSLKRVYVSSGAKGSPYWVAAQIGPQSAVRPFKRVTGAI
jgi:hypothetical protein